MQNRPPVKERVEIARASLGPVEQPAVGASSLPDTLAKEDRAPSLKRGRPSIGEPWKAEGVSKRTWYRRQKKDAAK